MDGKPGPVGVQTPPHQLDHDRRRVVKAVRTLLGKKDAPPKQAKPDAATSKHAPSERPPQGPARPAPSKFGKALVEVLAKSMEGEDAYLKLIPHMQLVAHQLAHRDAFHEAHDVSAVMLLHAQGHMRSARGLLSRPKPGRVDGLRTFLGMKSQHQKHLDAATNLIRVAHRLAVQGDRALIDQGRMQPNAFNQAGVPSSWKEPILNAPVRLARARAESQGYVKGMAQRFKDNYHATKPATP